MDILNWLRIKKQNLIRTTLDSPKDLIVLGADVSFQKRGDKYQSYAIPAEDLGIALGVNPQFISASGTTTGAGVTVSNSVLIPANTISNPKAIEFIAKFYRVSGTTATINSYLFTNTTNTIVGASLLATGGAITTGIGMGTLARTMNYVGGVIKTLSAASLFASDYTAQAISSVAFDPTVDNYFMFVNSVSAGDTAVCQSYRITIY
jgi:hypothetical protein